jgi:hypothetical protein
MSQITHSSSHTSSLLGSSPRESSAHSHSPSVRDTHVQAWLDHAASTASVSSYSSATSQSVEESLSSTSAGHSSSISMDWESSTPSPGPENSFYVASACNCFATVNGGTTRPSISCNGPNPGNWDYGLPKNWQKGIKKWEVTRQKLWMEDILTIIALLLGFGIVVGGLGGIGYVGVMQRY